MSALVAVREEQSVPVAIHWCDHNACIGGEVMGIRTATKKKLVEHGMPRSSHSIAPSTISSP